MKFALAFLAFASVPTVLVPECVVVQDKICFQSQSQYDKYMGWGPEQQKLEMEANK